MTQSANCPKCGNPTLPGAGFCAFCGNPLAQSSIPPSPPRERKVALPARDGLRGPCSIVYAGREEMDVRRVGRLVAETVGQPLPDVTRSLRSSKGFLATKLPAEKAVDLAGKLESELHAPVFVVADESVVALPPPLRMHEAYIGPDGLRCQAYSWDSTEPVQAAWSDVFLICCGRLEVQEVVESREEPTGRAFIQRVPNLVTRTRYEYLIDIILFEPWRRLRLDQNMAGFSLTEMNQGPEQTLGPLYRCATNLERFAHGVPMNKGVPLLAAGGSETLWQPLTFLHKRDFDLYVFWLLQVVRYGGGVPG